MVCGVTIDSTVVESISGIKYRGQGSIGRRILHTKETSGFLVEGWELLKETSNGTFVYGILCHLRELKE